MDQKMLYNVNINIPYCCKHGLKFEHASLLVLFMKSQTWADTMEYKGKVYYRLNMTKIKSDLPILSDKDDTIYRYIKTLIEKGMVEKVPKVDYYRCTTLGIEYDYHTTTINNNDSQSDESEKNPTPIGKKSESEKFPTYNNTNVKDNNDYSITNNILSKDNTTSDDVGVSNNNSKKDKSDYLNIEKEKEKSSAKKEKESYTGHTTIDNLLDEFMVSRKQMKKPMTQLAKDKLIHKIGLMLETYKIKEVEDCISLAIESGRLTIYEPRQTKPKLQYEQPKAREEFTFL